MWIFPWRLDVIIAFVSLRVSIDDDITLRLLVQVIISMTILNLSNGISMTVHNLSPAFFFCYGVVI